MGLHQPRDASQQSGIARPERRLRSGRVSVLLERHHQRRRRHGREDLAEGRDAEPKWLRPGSARVSPGKETQLVLSASGGAFGSEPRIRYATGTAEMFALTAKCAHARQPRVGAAPRLHPQGETDGYARPLPLLRL